jgi:hypothetical protein
MVSLGVWEAASYEIDVQIIHRMHAELIFGLYTSILPEMQDSS